MVPTSGSVGMLVPSRWPSTTPAPQHDGPSVALTATRTWLRQVIDDAQPAVLRIQADRRQSLGEVHTGIICQLHRLLLELIPAV